MLYNIICNMCLSIISTVIIGWLTLLQAPLQRRNCPSSSITRSFLAPLLSFCHSDMPWLPPPILPHPEVELIQPTSVAPPRAGIGNSSIAFAKLMRQDGCAVSSHKALHHWHTTKHVLIPAQIKARQVSAACTVVEHGHSFSLHDGINRQLDGLECAEENQSCRRDGPWEPLCSGRTAGAWHTTASLHSSSPCQLQNQTGRLRVALYLSASVNCFEC
jgi:hypothetical protein